MASANALAGLALAVLALGALVDVALVLVDLALVAAAAFVDEAEAAGAAKILAAPGVGVVVQDQLSSSARAQAAPALAAL